MTWPDSREPVGRAVITVNDHELHQILLLPDGLQIVRIQPVVDPFGMQIMVEGEALEPVSPDMYAPALPGWLSREQAIGPDGEVWYKPVKFRRSNA